MPPTNFDTAETLGHAFRSRLLDQFARIELWISGKASEIGGKVSTASLGQKAKLIVQTAHRFKKPKRIEELAERIEVSVDWRNDLVHSCMKTLMGRDGSICWLFENVSAVEQRRPLVMTQMQFEQEISNLKKLAKELEDQKLKDGTEPFPTPKCHPIA